MASRGTWTIQVKSGGAWGANATITRPNDNFPMPKISTQTKTKLANGDNAFITPETKYVDEPLTFIWYEDDGTIKTQIEGYITSQNDLKITDDLSNIFYGRFISINPTRIVGLSAETYDITSIFEIIPGLA